MRVAVCEEPREVGKEKFENILWNINVSIEVLYFWGFILRKNI